jgi:hypothetical protein
MARRARPDEIRNIRHAVVVVHGPIRHRRPAIVHIPVEDLLRARVHARLHQEFPKSARRSSAFRPGPSRKVAMMFVEAPIMEMSRVSDSGGAGNPALAYE